MKFKKSHILAITIQAIAVPLIGLPLLVSGETARPNSMTVDDCISRTGMTENQCQEMMDKFKNMVPPKDGSKIMPPWNGQRQLPAGEKSGDRPAPNTRININASNANDAKIEKISTLQAEKKQRLIQIESRITKIIEFLKSKEIETSEAESAFETFKAKIADVLSAFDVYVQSLKNAKTDTSENSITTVKNAKEQVNTALDDLVGSYRTLRIALNDAISKTNQ